MDHKVESTAFKDHDDDYHVNWSNIDIADNGWIVEHSVRMKTKTSSSFEDTYSHTHRELFSSEEEDKAWERFKYLKKKEIECSHKKKGY